MPSTEFDPAARRNAATLIEMALAEDLGDVGDMTSDLTIPATARGAARFVARQFGIVAGLPVVAMLAERFEPALALETHLADGDHLTPGSVLATVSGSMRSLLGFERTALNFLQRLSGIATLTGQYVAVALEDQVKILDTRKTTPGWRSLEKYAVRCGGGANHRQGLYDGILIKDNHLAWLAGSRDPIGVAIAKARTHGPAFVEVEVEVDTLEQFDRALECRPDIILLDNFGPDAIAEAVRRRNHLAPGILLEYSGGVTLAAVNALARTGVDRISVGALTHSAPALDIGLDFDRPLP